MEWALHPSLRWADRARAPPMTLPITLAPELAAQLHAELRGLVTDLHAAASNEEHGQEAGLRAALTVVLHSVRDLEKAVLPAPSAALPSDAQLGWGQPEQISPACSTPVTLTLEPARAVATACMARSQALNRVLSEIQTQYAEGKAPRELVKRFGFVMGHLYTEICWPLYRQHPELEPAWLREP